MKPKKQRPVAWLVKYQMRIPNRITGEDMWMASDQIAKRRCDMSIPTDVRNIKFIPLFAGKPEEK